MTELATSDKIASHDEIKKFVAKYKHAFQNKGMTDEEALLEGIRIQNNHYAKCLKLIQYLANSGCIGIAVVAEARELLQEIGEE